MRLGVETPLSRGVVRKDSVGVREAPSRACCRRTLGTWQVLRGVEGCVLPAGVPPAVVIAGTGRHVARVCWKGETVLEESLTVLAELYAFLRQCWQNWTAPMAVFPSLTHLRLIALRSSLAIGVSSFSPFWAMLLPCPARCPSLRRGTRFSPFDFLVLHLSTSYSFGVQTLYRDLTVSSESQFTGSPRGGGEGEEAGRKSPTCR